jgi:sugar O-acyltransferase (sialic acid O-acetyltransferase NeuD family)
MLSNELTILGLSEATMSMILDILESNGNYTKISVINNLKRTADKEYLRNGFEFEDLFDLNKISGQFVIGTGQPKNRKKVRNVFDQIRDDQFIKLVNKSADLSSTVKLGKGIIINSLTCIAAHTAIGDFSFINRGCTIGHHTNLEKYVTINPGVNIAGNVSIGEGSLIGLGSNVIDGIKIGSNSIIGAGSVVTKDIPDNVVAYGSPCKIIRANEA